MTLLQIHAWEDTLPQQYPELVSILTIGQSFEGRPLRVIKISNSKNNESKPAVWIDGGNLSSILTDLYQTFHL